MSTKLEQDAAWAQELVEANSIPFVCDILARLLSERTSLDGGEVDDVVDALAEPIAYARSRTREDAYAHGVAETKRHLASRMGLL